MTSLPRPGRPLRLPAAIRALVVTVLAIVGLLALGTVTASAGTLPDGGNRVGVSAPETIFPVGAFDGVSAGEGRGRPAPHPRTVVATGVAAETAATNGWRVGGDIYAPTRAGNAPTWTTVRGRFWKNEAANPQIDSNWSQANLDRMARGSAPQRYNADKGGMESMELSHEPIPYRDGGTNVVPRWPQDHAAIDPFRHPGY